MIDGQIGLVFDGAAAKVEAQQGMDAALNAERVQFWKQAAAAWLAEADAGTEVTADDLVAIIGLPDAGVYRNNAVGAWFSAQAKAGRIVFTGRFRASKRTIGHGNLQRIWRVR